MKIDSGQLTAFAAVMREGSFETAARTLHITQSAMSQRIKQLETRLGQVLVQRSSPCCPTDSGKVLLKLAEQVALLEAETLRALAGYSGTERVRLPIVVNTDSLESWFWSMLDSLPNGHAICIDLKVEDQDRSAILLREGTVMAAVTVDPGPVQGCEVQRLGAMRYMGVAAPTFVHRYFSSGVNSGAFDTAPMVIFDRNDSMQARFVAQFTPNTVNPPTHCVSSVLGFVEAAVRGLGWCMVPEQLARPRLQRGELAEIAPGHFLDVSLYWQRWRLNSDALKLVTEAVRLAARQWLRV